MRVVGIDPGIDGGLAFLDSRSKALPDIEVMPVYQGRKGRELDVCAISDWIEARDPDLVVIEESTAMAGWGVAPVFKYGRGYGRLESIVMLLGVEMHEVSPKKWKNRMLPDTNRDKGVAIGWCLRKWPRIDLLASPRCRVPHDGMADALVIAGYGVAEGHCLLSTKT